MPDIICQICGTAFSCDTYGDAACQGEEVMYEPGDGDVGDFLANVILALICLPLLIVMSPVIFLEWLLKRYHRWRTTKDSPHA